MEAPPALEAGGLVHRVRSPDGPGPHPTVVMLHGRSGDENVMWVFASALPGDWLIVAPRALKPDPDGGYTWHPRKANEWPPLTAFDESVAAVVRFVQTLPELYKADPNRIYLMGFSQGAALAYATAMRHPDLIEGIAGLMGFVPEDSDSESLAALKGLPIFMAAGAHDALIPLEHARESARVLREAGAALDYHEYDTGHRLSAQGMRDLKRWWTLRATHLQGASHV
jgi:phospholipase/carboxylesterase